MTSRLSWTAGLGVGYTWTACMGTNDLVSMATGYSVLSSAAAVTNQTAQDLYIDISVKITITSSTPTAGGSIGLYLCYLNQDGTTYDPYLTAGTALAAYQPLAYPSVGSINLTATATTVLAGNITGILTAPGTYSFVLWNNSGLTFSATNTNNVVKYRSYILNDNA
jgi:hypothetical protein